MAVMLSLSSSSRSAFAVGTSPAAARAPARQPARSSAVRTSALFGFGKKSEEKSERELDREDQFRMQQEVLARRRGNKWQDDVKTRRAKVSRYLNDPEFKKQCDAENRANFKKRQEEAGPEPKFAIIIPILPVGIPEYDGGERFDLRLPYVDNGWVDDDADFFKQVGRFFGGGKKKPSDEGSSAAAKKGKKK